MERVINRKEKLSSARFIHKGEIRQVHEVHVDARNVTYTFLSFIGFYFVKTKNKKKRRKMEKGGCNKCPTLQVHVTYVQSPCVWNKKKETQPVCERESGWVGERVSERGEWE